MSNLEILDARVSQLISDVRAECIEQLPLWQGLPSLALDADWDHEDPYSINDCTLYGTWRLMEITYFQDSRSVTLSVDCATGKIITSDIYRDEEYPEATDEEILILLGNLKCLNAESITNRLIRHSQTTRPADYPLESWGRMDRMRQIARMVLEIKPGKPYVRQDDLINLLASFHLMP